MGWREGAQNCEFVLTVLFGSGWYVPWSSPLHKEEAAAEFCATSSSGNKFSDFPSSNVTKLLYVHIYYIYIHIYIYLWLHWVFVTEHRLSWIVGGASLFLPGCGISLRASHCSGLSHCRARALANSGFSRCGLRAQSRSLVVNCTGLDTLLKPNTKGQTLYDFICIRYLK